MSERCVGELIVEILQAKDPSGNKEFRPVHIYDGYYKHPKVMWIPMTSLSSELHLHRNQISNIEPLAGLTKLARLDLSENQISNIEPLADLVRLTKLDLHINQINDIAPLVELNC